jgi:hypothetical protein
MSNYDVVVNNAKTYLGNNVVIKNQQIKKRSLWY